jgi:hypothetical protein
MFDKTKEEKAAAHKQFERIDREIQALKEKATLILNRSILKLPPGTESPASKEFVEILIEAAVLQMSNKTNKEAFEAFYEDEG